MSEDLSYSKAKQEFDKIIEGLKELVRPYMQTKEGRDQIRRTFGCRIEGCEEEEKDFKWSPGDMFHGPSPW